MQVPVEFRQSLLYDVMWDISDRRKWKYGECQMNLEFYNQLIQIIDKERVLLDENGL